MALGDITWDSDGYGMKEVQCTLCVGITGVIESDCQGCEGGGITYRMTAPEGEIEAAVSNVMQQVNARLRPN